MYVTIGYHERPRHRRRQIVSTGHWRHDDETSDEASLNQPRQCTMLWLHWYDQCSSLIKSHNRFSSAEIDN